MQILETNFTENMTALLLDGAQLMATWMFRHKQVTAKNLSV
jgi:hypothetical protein